MKTADEIIYPRWIIPVDNRNSVLEGHGVVVGRGRILAVDTCENLSARFTAERIVRLEDHVLMPGLVNAHTHAAMTLFRGYANDMPLMEWLSKHIWPAESRWVDERFVETGTDLACAEMIRNGITCFNDMYFFPDAVARRCEAAGMRVCVGMIVIEFPTVWAKDAGEYIQKGLDVHDQLRSSSLASACFAPHAPYTVECETLSRIAGLSEELSCPVHIHLNETAQEVADSRKQYGESPVERLDRLGLINQRLNAVHMTQATPEEIRLFAERNASITHCPESNLKLASGMCPVADFLEAGVNIAIGTDGASSNNDLDMIGEMQTASLLAKGVSGLPDAMDAYTSIRAATLNGAVALGMNRTTGSIETGKSADLTAVNIMGLSTQPLYDPVCQLVYCASREQVSDVWVSGRRLLASGELTTIDQERVLALAGEWRNKIAC